MPASSNPPDFSFPSPHDTLAQRSLQYVWHPCTQMKQHAGPRAVPLVSIQRAAGVWLYDYQGRRILDALSSWWVNLFGHSHPHIQAALREQLAQLDHVMLAGFTHAPVVELSQRLHELTGLGHAFYGSDGASATEIALKMSAHYWRNAGRPEKCRFVGLAGGYHGETVGALAVTDIDIFRTAYAPLVRLGATVPSPDARQAQPGESAADVAQRCARTLEAWLAAHHAETAALILEPLVQCAAGMAMYDPLYLREARALCDRYEVHLVVDEIATGFGRTGSLFAHQQAGIRPDFLCLSKGITGGTLPLSVVLTTDAVYEAFYDDEVARGFLHSHSYTGNPLACRAALATLELFAQTQAIGACRTLGVESENAPQRGQFLPDSPPHSGTMGQEAGVLEERRSQKWAAAAHSQPTIPKSDRLLERNQALAQQISRALAPLSEHPRVRHARRQGMIWAWDVQTRLPDFSQRLHHHALAHGVLLRPIGHALYIMPPYVMDDEAIDWLARGALGALEATLAEEGQA